MGNVQTSIENVRLRVTHYGEARISDHVAVECAVLNDGRRGYVMRGLRTAIGMKTNVPLPAFDRFCAEIAPNALKIMEKTSSRFEVSMPNGAVGIWVEAGVLTQLASGVVRAALTGKLRANRKHMVDPCLAIVDALGNVGETALIDEATGYQYHRAPDALQDLISRIIREEASDWEQRFHPEYYSAVCRVIGVPYGNKHRALPPLVGKITRDWVYDVILPAEIMGEIKSRGRSEKIHQWLTKEDGIRLLERQKEQVTTIAKSSVDYRDFEARCSAAFHKIGQQVKMNFPQGEAA